MHDTNGSIPSERLLSELQTYQRELEMQNEILRESQLQLAASRDAYMTLHDMTPVAIITTDSEGIIHRANEAMSTLVGLPISRIEGHHLFSFVSDDHRRSVVSGIIDAQAKGVWRPLEVSIPGGPERPRRDVLILGRICPSYPFADGLRHALLLSLVDVTTQHEQQRALEHARSIAEDAAKTKGEFLAAMSHEIRTPLNGLMGINALLADMDLPHEARDLLLLMRGSGEELLRLLTEILDMARLDANRVEVERILFDLHQVVEEVATLYAPSVAARGLELILDLDPQTPRRAMGDQHRLRQVLQNLLGNAIKFSESGTITLSVGNGDGHLRFAVRDEGIGMDAATVERIFSPFVQADMSTSRRYGGTGLGLSIASRLVALMGGQDGGGERAGPGQLLLVHAAHRPRCATCRWRPVRPPRRACRQPPGQPRLPARPSAALGPCGRDRRSGPGTVGLVQGWPSSGRPAGLHRR
jgi:two-component system sensor histidine kinase/response regulator